MRPADTWADTWAALLGAPDLERELLSIDREEKKLIVEIKAAARNGNEKGAKLLARSLVRLRGQRTKVLASAAQLRGVRATIGVGARSFIRIPWPCASGRLCQHCCMPHTCCGAPCSAVHAAHVQLVLASCSDIALLTMHRTPHTQYRLGS